MGDANSKRGSGGGVAWPAALPPVLAMMAALFVPPAAAGLSHASQALREGGIGMVLVVASALAGAVSAGVLSWFAARRRAVPGALPLFAAFWPWLTGLGASAWSFHRVLRAVRHADAASRSTLIARGFAESGWALSFGALLSGALFAGVALSSSLAAAGQEAEERRRGYAVFALFGLVILLLPVPLAPALRGRWILALPGLAALPALAMAGASLGEGPGGRRAFALASTSAAAVVLSVLATGASVGRVALLMVFQALAGASLGSRLPMAAAGVSEATQTLHAALYTALVALLPWALLALAGRKSVAPTLGRVVGGALTLSLVAGGFAFLDPPSPSVAWTLTTPNVPSSPLLVSAAGVPTAADVDFVLTSRGPVDAAGRPVEALAPPSPTGGARRGLVCGGLGPNTIRVALGADVSMRSLAELSERVKRRPDLDVALFARASEVEREQLARVERASPLLALLVRAPLREVHVAPATAELARCLREQPQRWTARVGAEAAQVIHDAAGVERPLAIDPDAPWDDQSARPLVELSATPGATPLALFETAAAIEAAGMRPVFGELPALPIDGELDLHAQAMAGAVDLSQVSGIGEPRSDRLAGAAVPPRGRRGCPPLRREPLARRHPTCDSPPQERGALLLRTRARP